MERRGLIISLMLFLVLVMFHEAAYVSEIVGGSDPVPSAGQNEKVTGPLGKAARGVRNVTFGWTEIPRGIVARTRAAGPLGGMISGVLRGTCDAFARTVSGAADLATFPMGGYDKPAILPEMSGTRE
jgi:putative exosortase-associated protein (TIGR04073 family)